MCKETNVTQEMPSANSKGTGQAGHTQSQEAKESNMSEVHAGDSLMMDLSFLRRPPQFIPNKVPREGASNFSHIRHGGYFVDLNYP